MGLKGRLQSTKWGPPGKTPQMAKDQGLDSFSVGPSELLQAYNRQW